MPKEYIEREAAIDGLREHLRYMLDGTPISQGTRDIYEMAYRHCIDKINSLPAADVVERKKGKWIKCNNRAGYKCSVCKARVSNADVLNGNHNYCYKCGADMRGVDNG